MSIFRGVIFKNYKKFQNSNIVFLTIFRAAIPIIFIFGFFSAVKKDFLEESKNGHFKNVQNRNLMGSLNAVFYGWNRC
jgi:hypothetical protein